MSLPIHILTEFVQLSAMWFSRYASEQTRKKDESHHHMILSCTLLYRTPPNIPYEK